MASSTGVLPFVRGLDLSSNDFAADLFPQNVGEMTGLRWLKLNKTNLERVPEELSQLKQLEHLQMINNNLSSIHGEISDMPMLRSVIVRHNQVKTSGIPEDLFDMQDLTVVDFSHNQLREVPSNLDHARSTIVLNLSHNNLEVVPNGVFVNMTDVLNLNLSHNKLEVLPPQIRRLTDLQVLVLNDNPMQHFQLKQLPSMTHLRVLHMRNTQRNGSNIPPTLDNLVNLEDVDFSSNELEIIPDALFKLKNLRKLNLSDNQIVEVAPFCECWQQMEILNLSRNKLKALPDMICKLLKMKKLFVNNNEINFDGIPAGIGKLVNLEVFHAAYNQLELVPEGLSRCVKLKKIKLNHNCLVTLPGTLRLLPDLQELDLHNNPDLVMPPTLQEMQKGSGLQFYNIDFSLEHQMKLAGTSPHSSMSSSPTPSSKDPVARKIQFLKRRKGQSEADSDQKKILKGMTDIAKEKNRAEQELFEQQTNLRPKRWDEGLEKPSIDYSEIFEEGVGQLPGLYVWEIENFLPNLLDEAFHGKFYEGDGYIVLRAFIDDTNSLNWQIFYWIGEKSTLDKKACAAIHAVNLRNFLGATCRTQREEMNDESDEFLELFGDEIVYIEGGRTLSGFYTVEEKEVLVRLYRVHGKGAHIHLESVALQAESLDPRFVFLLDATKEMFVWHGKKSKGVLRSKARLFAEKVNKNERKGFSEIEMINQGEETPRFWQLLTGKEAHPEEPIVEHVSPDFQPSAPILYQVTLGMGYLELPQVEMKHKQMTKELLQTRHVYLLDCFTDVFIWIGKKSTRLIRAAGVKLATELLSLINRPEHAVINRVCEGTETLLFKSKFSGWDDVLAVDFTRTAESITRRGADLNLILERDKIKTDLTSFFLDRQPLMSDEEAEQLMQDCNEDLELMEPFVLEGKKFIRLPEDEFGVFYTTDCYVFLCRYWVPPDDDNEDTVGSSNNPEKLKLPPLPKIASSASFGNSSRAKTASESHSEENPHSEDESFADAEEPEGTGESSHNVVVAEPTPPSPPPQDDFQCVVYFWQGRDASNMGWLTFTFSLQKKFESLFKDKLEVVRMYQQQENQKFLSHFKKKFVIRRGRRNLTMYSGCRRWPELYHLRSNGSSVCTRTISLEVKAELLNSGFCYLLKCPYVIPEDDGEKGKSFIWIGGKSKPTEAILLEEITHELLNKEEYPVEVIQEGQEPPLFWKTLGGKKPYETNADFMLYSRLFRCTNEKGYFAVSEKTIDFCQDDLDDDDVMILDNGEQIFLWVGSKASEVEVKLAYKATQVYLQHLRLKQPERPRKLVATLKGKESRRFTKCFHAFGKYKIYDY